jgi:predicted metalloprotease
MQWRGRRQSSNIEDRRGSGGMARPAGIGGIGLLIVIVLGMVFGVDLTPLLGPGGGPVVNEAPSGPNQIDDENEAFVSVVLAETEDVWGEMFSASGLQYSQPRLVLFTGQTSSGCGFAQSAMGPFYCPNDQTVYLDVDFFRVMQQQLGSRGEFARAYRGRSEQGLLRGQQ